MLVLLSEGFDYILAHFSCEPIEILLKLKISRFSPGRDYFNDILLPDMCGHFPTKKTKKKTKMENENNGENVSQGMN